MLDHGAEWIHYALHKEDPGRLVPENPLLEHARKLGHPTEHDDQPQKFYSGGKELRHGSEMSKIKRGSKAIAGHAGPDVDLETFFEEKLGDAGSSLESTFGVAETGRKLRKTGVIEMQNIVSRNMGELSPGGLGEFIEKYAAPVKSHIRLNTPVSEIDWTNDGKRGVTVYTKNGDVYHAKHCIPTVSIGVLKSGAIKFRPSLPEEYQDNLSHIEMGDFNKIHIIFKNEIGKGAFKFTVNRNTHMDVHTKGGDDIFYLARVNGQQLVTAFMGDDLARLCDDDPAAATEKAIKGLCEIWGDDVRNHIAGTYVTRWKNNPFVCGGYSLAEVGHYDVREALTKPIGGKIYLAGEAIGARHPELDMDYSTHMTGAVISGERAANAIINAQEKIRTTSHRREIRRSDSQIVR